MTSDTEEHPIDDYFENADSDIELSEDVFLDVEDFGGVELLPHQKKVIKYLVSKCKKQKGLLVNHYQGTGKTLTGIFFMKNYKRYKKVVMAPEALKSMWQTACKDNDISNDVSFVSYEYLERIQDYDHEEFEKEMVRLNAIIDNSILVSDESHNLLDIFKFCQSQGSESIVDLSTVKERPKYMTMWKDDNDAIASYRNKLKNYLQLFGRCKKVIFLTGTPVKDYVADVRWFINLSAGDIVVPYIKEDFTEKYLVKNKIFETLGKIVKPLMQIFDVNIVPEYLQEEGIDKYRSNLTMLIDKVLEDKLTGNSIIDQTIKKLIGNTLMKNIKLYLQKFTVDRLDPPTIDWGKYVSFYKYENLDYYPSMTIKNKPVTYTEYQYEVWRRGNINKLTYSESVALRFIDNLENAKLFKCDSSEDINHKQGRIIGNMGRNPMKFIQIAEAYKANMASTLVYSNYYESGILLFSEFLREQGIEHTIFHTGLSTEEKERMLDDFKDQKINLLLLHPSFFEGFSIKGVRKFHILEPVDSYYMKDQLYTRVVRFKSHDHLPKEQRNVEITQWYCTFSNLIGQAKKIKLQIQNLDIDLEKLNFDGSPDDNMMEQVNLHEGMLNDLSRVLQKVSVDNNEVLQNLNDECCIYGDECDGLPKCEDLDVGLETDPSETETSNSESFGETSSK